MKKLEFYIDGRWVSAHGNRTLDVINPATQASCGTIALGDSDDVNAAVSAAETALYSYSRTTVQERLELLEAIIAEYQHRSEDLATTLSTEMGAPIGLARKVQVPSGLGHFTTIRKVIEDFSWHQDRKRHRLVREPIGVCAMITPWNWPLNQIACKVAPALAAGCTMVLKPSEVAPLNAIILAEILDTAGVPSGVFNLVNGDGPGVGQALAAHPAVNMISFTGSTRAGIQVAKTAADSVKRVAQELGGKSPNIVLPDADLERAVTSGVRQICNNTGQSCNAPSRMLVPVKHHDQVLEIAARAAQSVVPGDPFAEDTTMGPLVSETQWNRVQNLIQTGIDEGARLACGGVGRPEDLTKGFYARPTVFGDVDNAMKIAREEIFGPVLCVIPYKSIDEAIEIANDTPYGLSAYVQSTNVELALEVASQLQAGNVHINGAHADLHAPFGGYKQSGNGREWGEAGLEEYLEKKAIFLPKSA